MKIDQLPKVSLTQLKTPIEVLKNLTQKLNGPSLYIKRDDLTDLALGGNKTRKLEYLIGDAKQKRANTLITAGGIQSNHCRLTAAAACKTGLDCELVLAGSKAEKPNGNLLLDEIFGAKINWCERDQREATMNLVVERLQQEGKRPYMIPVGGSNEVGTVGYVAAMKELKEQIDAMNLTIDTIVVASSSGGTHAGLQLGAKLFGFDGTILGLSIDQVKIGVDSFLPVLAKIANATAERLESDIVFREDSFQLICDYLGDGYAIPGEMEREAIQLLSRLEGILLGPVYTARAMGGLIDLIRQGYFESNHNILFWHTGGVPELFAYNEWIC